MKKRIPRFHLNKNRLLLILLGLAFALTLLVGLFSSLLVGILFSIPDTDLKNLSTSYYQTSSIYDESGNLLENIESEEFRTIIPLKDMPENLRKSFIAIEDKRFYQHRGLDPRGIASSLLDNFRAGSMVRGGSTITQQLARNVFLSQEKSLDRKIKEAYLSLRLESVLSKDQILEAYLNRINLGQGAYGVQGASQTYFSKNAKDLTLAQSALLAGIVKSPRDYSPLLRVPVTKKMDRPAIGQQEISGVDYNLYLNPKSLDRQKIVLAELYRQGKISKEDYETAKKEDVLASIVPLQKKHHSMSSYAMDLIKAQASQELAKTYQISLDEAEHKLFTGGYHIETSLNLDLQGKIENFYKHFLEDYLIQTSYREGARALTFQSNDQGHVVDANGEILYLAKDQALDPQLRFFIPADQVFNDQGQLSLPASYFSFQARHIYIKPLYSIDASHVLKTYDLGQWKLEDGAKHQGDRVLISKNFLTSHPDFMEVTPQGYSFNPNYYSPSQETIQPQLSTVLIDNQTGYVRAIIGGLDIQSKGSKLLNRATMSPRVPGTAILPFNAYLTALEYGKKPATIYDDALEENDGVFWPENPSGKYYGLETMRKNLEHDSYTVPVKIVKDLGFKRVLVTLARLGIYKPRTPRDDFFVQADEEVYNDLTLDSLGLGNMRKGTTCYNLATGYYGLAAGGSYKEPTIIKSIKDPSGSLIYQSKNRKNKKLCSRENAAILTDFLRTNAIRGQAAGVSVKNNALAAIYGANKFASDQWLFGYTPYYTIGTWMGCDQPKVSLNSNKDFMIDLWNQVAYLAHKPLESIEKFPLPDQIHYVNISEKSGLLASSQTERARANYDELFEEGQEPTSYDTKHRTYKVCRLSGKRITKFCPYDTIILKSFYQRPDPYQGKKRPDKLPMDMENIDQDFCDIHTREWFEDQLEKERDQAREKSRKQDRQGNRKKKKDDQKKDRKKQQGGSRESKKKNQTSKKRN